MAAKTVSFQASARFSGVECARRAHLSTILRCADISSFFVLGTVLVHMLAAVLRRLAGLSNSPSSSSGSSGGTASPLVPLASVYITCPSPFPTLEAFVRASESRYGLRLVTVKGPMKEGLRTYLEGGGVPGVPDRKERESDEEKALGSEKGGEGQTGNREKRGVKAVFVGTRRADPHGGKCRMVFRCALATVFPPLRKRLFYSFVAALVVLTSL